MAAPDMLKLPLTGSHLFYGDNLDILRANIPDESVDLIYLDPPFNSQATYNVLFRAPTGEQSQAQIEAFEDTWHWNSHAEDAFDQVMQSGNTQAAEMLRAIRGFLGVNDMMAYITMMAVRLLELHRTLKPTGSLYLHCDPTASHYLKLLLDSVFGPDKFRSEIIWKRTSAHSGAKRWGPIHDVIFFYTKSDKYTWNIQYQPLPRETADAWYNNVEPETNRRFNRADLTASGTRTGSSGTPWRGVDPTSKGRHWAIPGFVGLDEMDTLAALDALDKAGRLFWPKKADGIPMVKRYLDESKGIPAQDVIGDIGLMNNMSEERLGYPTQKPLALLERIVRASSNPGDVVMDPFCGCGTSVHAAQKLGDRTWIGIDVTHLAISLIEMRLKNAFKGTIFTVHGTPKDFGGAQALALADKYQFQWWAVSLIDAVPFGGRKKGADGGIDGFVYFKPDGRTTEKAIVSIKGGANVGVSMVKDLITTVNHEKAKIGIFITLTPPTKPMLAEAAKAGFYEPPHHAKVPKIQIMTIQELFDHKKPQVPMVTSVFKKAGKEEATQEGFL